MQASLLLPNSHVDPDDFRFSGRRQHLNHHLVPIVEMAKTTLIDGAGGERGNVTPAGTLGHVRISSHT